MTPGPTCGHDYDRLREDDPRTGAEVRRRARASRCPTSAAGRSRRARSPPRTSTPPTGACSAPGSRSGAGSRTASASGSSKLPSDDGRFELEERGGPARPPPAFLDLLAGARCAVERRSSRSRGCEPAGPASPSAEPRRPGRGRRRHGRRPRRPESRRRSPRSRPRSSPATAPGWPAIGKALRKAGARRARRRARSSRACSAPPACSRAADGDADRPPAPSARRPVRGDARERSRRPARRGRRGAAPAARRDPPRRARCCARRAGSSRPAGPSRCARSSPWLGGLLGPVRDLDVLLEHLDGEAAALEGDDARAFRRLRARLAAERDAATATTLLEAMAERALLPPPRRARRQPQRPPPASSRTSLPEIAGQAFARLRKAVKALPKHPTDDELHARPDRDEACALRRRAGGSPTLGKAGRQVRRAGEGRAGRDRRAPGRRASPRSGSASWPFAAAGRPGLPPGRLVERQRQRKRAARRALPGAWRRLDEGRAGGVSERDPCGRRRGRPRRERRPRGRRSSTGPKYDDWTLPKGKADAGESDEDCALREVEEETGLRCERGRGAGERLVPRRGRPAEDRPLLADAPDRRGAASRPGRSTTRVGSPSQKPSGSSPTSATGWCCARPRATDARPRGAAREPRVLPAAARLLNRRQPVEQLEREPLAQPAAADLERDRRAAAGSRAGSRSRPAAPGRARARCRARAAISLAGSLRSSRSASRSSSGPSVRPTSFFAARAVPPTASARHRQRRRQPREAPAPRRGAHDRELVLRRRVGRRNARARGAASRGRRSGATQARSTRCRPRSAPSRRRRRRRRPSPADSDPASAPSNASRASSSRESTRAGAPAARESTWTSWSAFAAWRPGEATTTSIRRGARRRALCGRSRPRTRPPRRACPRDTAPLLLDVRARGRPPSCRRATTASPCRECAATSRRIVFDPTSTTATFIGTVLSPPLRPSSGDDPVKRW